MSRDVTSIEIKTSTWRTLNQMKEPGDSFDDVIQRLLEDDENDEFADGGPVPGFERTCPDCGLEFESAEAMLEHVQSTEPDH